MYRLSKNKVSMVLAILGVVSSDGQCNSNIPGCHDDSICCSWADFKETDETKKDISASDGRKWRVKLIGDNALMISTQKGVIWEGREFPSRKNCVKKLIIRKDKRGQRPDLEASQKLCKDVLQGKVVSNNQCTDKLLITQDKNSNVKFEAY